MSIKVVKRDGRVVDFDKEKIKNVIIKAMSETKNGVDEELAKLISIDIFAKLNTNISVEEIQDIVENKLMESNRKDVAKSYIIYRYERNKKRNIKDSKFNLLDDEFISKYKHTTNPMDQLGSFVYYRTYSRWLDKENRRENWWETARRAVEYNCNLVNTTKQEAQELYDNIFNLRQYLSGRTFWVGGTKVSTDFPTSNFNCFRRNTEFLTKYGLKTFENFENGDIVEVLDKNGGWVPSVVRNYGKDQLYRLIINRGKHYEEIYTTKNHLWFIKRKNTYDKYIKQETAELKSGDILKYVRRYTRTNLNIDPMAIMHGIVFGDGSYNTTKNFCQVRLCGDKIGLLKYFNGYSNCKIKNTEDIFIYGLPYNFKQPPALNTNPEYIKGFLLGLMLTDGTIKKSIKISQTDHKALKHIQSLFEIIGITSDQIIEYHRVNNNYNVENEYYYTLTLHKKSFYWHFPEFNNSTKVNDIEWSVVSVEKTDIIEDVWCVEVPSTQSFTLRGGIHTHNCCFNIINSFNAFKDIFYLCLVGAGVGFRILKSDVENLPKVRTNLKLIHEDYHPKAKNERKDSTSLIYLDNDTVTLEIGDSKAGWVQGLDYYFKIISDNDYKNIKNLIINYDMVRPKGEPLKTFGGTASGHSSIKTMFIKINKLIQNYSVLTGRIKLRPIDCLDIATIIGENVVVGGVRRTALIGLIDWDDKDTIEAKDNLYILKNGNWESNTSILHRSMSNNSIFYEHKPTREQLHWQIEKMRYSGEPGWVNAEAARKRRKNMNGVNPCFRGDMKLLTLDGYKTFEELCDKEVEIINKDGDISLSKIWCSGEKEIYEIKLNQNTKNFSIFCTKNQIFMDINSKEIKAINLKGKTLMPATIEYNWCSKSLYDLGPVVVIDVVNTQKNEKVYDFNEPLTHWGVVEGVIAHNCGEILLDDHGMCNLVTVNVMGFIKDDVLDLNSLLRAQRLSARAAFRMTQIELELHEWDKVQKRDHIVGCSLTGWQDLVNALDYNNDNQRKLLSLLRKEARDAINSYCDELGIKEYPDAVTTIKPEGTLSQLSGVSSGVHYSHSPYFIRRIRITANDPLVKVAEELEWNINCENGQTSDNCNTKVIDFYCKAPEGRTKYDVSAIEQLENYKLFMESYVDHNASITVHVRNDEWDSVEEWVWNNWDNQVALSFLSLDDSFYQLMPYEAITKEEYKEKTNNMKPFIPSLLQKYESHEEHQVDSSDCSSGICPIR